MVRLSLILKHLNVRYQTGNDKDYCHKTWGISKHKRLEVEACKFNGKDNMLELTLDLIFRGSDHKGPELTIELFGYYFSLRLYDTRHWDYDLGTWEKYPGAIDEREEEELCL